MKITSYGQEKTACDICSSQAHKLIVVTQWTPERKHFTQNICPTCYKFHKPKTFSFIHRQ